MISLYINNFLITAKYQELIDWFMSHRKIEYNIKDLGKTKMIIGWQLTYDLETANLKIDQSAFIRDLLEEKDLAGWNSVNIPMKAESIIEMNNANNYKKTDIEAYQRLIGKLMYLSCGTRPDISFVIGQLGRRNADPRVGHLKAAKQVIRYLKGTMHLGII